MDAKVYRLSTVMPGAISAARPVTVSNSITSSLIAKVQ